MATITGRVTESYSGQPISGAVVTIGGYSTSTGPDGSFSIAVPSMSANVVVSHGGHETYSSFVNTDAASFLSITLSPRFSFL